jgi:hypothetical protein
MSLRRFSLILVGSLLATAVMMGATTSAQAKTLVGTQCTKLGARGGDGPGRTVVCRKIGKKTIWQLLILSNSHPKPGSTIRTNSPTPTPTESGGGSQGTTAPRAVKNANPNEGLHSYELFSMSRIYSKHGTPKFTSSPIDLNSIGFISPMGFTQSRMAPADSIFDPNFDPAIGANPTTHVLPADHGGLSFKNFEDNINFHPTFAVADGTIVAVMYQQGDFDPHPGTTQRLDSYSLIFQYTKNFFLQINHFTQLEPNLLKQIGSSKGLTEKITDIPVKDGQLLGMTGGTTNLGGFDFMVYDMDSKALSCSQSPIDQHAHSVDPYQFFVEPLRSQLYAKLPPRPEPRAGQWCYNIKEKLVGNWFFYYHGTVKTYQPGLGFFYDVSDPSKILIGDSQTGRDYTINGNAPDPATIDVNSGLIKYALTDDDPRNSGVAGVMLVQMTDKAKIKMEFFPNASADQVTGFTSGAQQLYR